jgi:hypothetical protein
MALPAGTDPPIGAATPNEVLRGHTRADRHLAALPPTGALPPAAELDRYSKIGSTAKVILSEHAAWGRHHRAIEVAREHRSARRERAETTLTVLGMLCGIIVVIGHHPVPGLGLSGGSYLVGQASSALSSRRTKEPKRKN